MTVGEDFRALAARIVDDMLAADPVSATWLGDHRFDDQLPDWSAAGVSGLLAAIDARVTELDAIDDLELAPSDLVDLEILRASLLASRFELDDLRSPTWNPLVWNPGTAVHLLLSREFAPADERRESLRGRLRAIPGFLEDARTELGEMPAIHVETALAQLAGTTALIAGEARGLAADDSAVETALEALAGFTDWLAGRLPESHRDPRLGERLYSAALWHGLDDDASAAVILRDAQEHLDGLTEHMREVAAKYLGLARGDDDAVRMALDEIARRSPVTDATVLAAMRGAVERATEFVRSRDLVGIPAIDVHVIEMPEIHRGVAVAYCDAPGPLETAVLPTYVAVAPTPAGWSADRVSSFYREYNGVQLHGLAIHEAMPGHVLQLARAQELAAASPVRRFGRSGVLVEGWAVYAEELMVDRGYRPDDDPRSGHALRLTQLKLQARGAINAILDVQVHAGGLTEAAGLALMRDRGFQEEGEAVGKWRRALLTAGQLPTYFVGYRAVRGIVADLRVLHPEWSDRQVHDLLLSHGSPAPKHLRTLLGI